MGSPLRRYVIPLIFGLGGFAVLLSLGLWQMQRLAWKEALLTEIADRIGAAPVALPDAPEIDAHRFLPVVIEGDFDGQDIPVFIARDGGPVYRLVASFETSKGRRVMVDRGGFSALRTLDPTKRTGPMAAVRVVGNLHWPDEADNWTPAPDATGVHYGRDLAVMAAELGTEPVLIVAREVSVSDGIATPYPVTSAGIPNNHLGYAVQWFGLAAVWAGMTIFLLWRIRKRRV
ncbi:MAG: SURF1 family protein [Silicimonas sp.]|nr:SURF1 family protein [Silicimonas sp.]